MDIHSKDNIELYIEMIENVLEHCFIKDEGGCVGCKFFTGDGFEKCVQNIGIKILGLIHRLRDENTEQKAEIERLTEKYQNAHREGYEHGKLENQYEIAELAIENAELQKQVDELAYELAKKSIATEGINVTSTDISLYLHEKLLEQAVKDTANKVYKGLCEKGNWNEMKDAMKWGDESEELKALISRIVGVEVE